MVDESDGARQVEIEVSIELPQLDAFQRSDPPGGRSGSTLWKFAIEMIDYGCSLFATHRTVRDSSPTRDLVVAALFRRALIVSESLRVVLWNGLPEAALPLMRTLLDIAVNMRLVTQDPSETTAKRLGAYHYFAVQRHQERILSDPLSRRLVEEFEGGKAQTVDLARKNALWFESPGFMDVRELIVPGKPWHGYERAADAFAAAGMSTDYYQTYDTATLFTHAANIDFDFADIVDGKVLLKAPLNEQPSQLETVLGVALTHLHAMMAMFVGDKQAVVEKGVVLMDGTIREEVNAMDALAFLLAQSLPESKAKLRERKDRPA